MKINTIIDKKDFEALKVEWTILLEKNISNNIYLTWEWLYTWWETFGDRTRSLFIIIFKEDGKIVGIAPFIIHNKKYSKLLNFRQIEFLGTGEDERDEVCSNYMDIIVAKGKEEQVINELSMFFKDCESSNWDGIFLYSILPDSLVSKLLKDNFNGKYINKKLQTSSCPYIDLGNNWENYLKSLGDKTRRNIRKDRRELMNSGSLEYEAYNQADTYKYFDDFMSLHRKRWEDRLNQDAFSSDKFVSFHKNLSSLFSQKGWLKISFLKHNKKIIAASYHFIYNGRLYAYQVGCDDEYNKKFSIGITEFGFNIEDAIKKGYKEYDFYKARPASYKWRLAKDKREVVDVAIFRKNFKFILFIVAKVLNAIKVRIKRLCHLKKKA